MLGAKNAPARRFRRHSGWMGYRRPYRQQPLVILPDCAGGRHEPLDYRGGGGLHSHQRTPAAPFPIDTRQPANVRPPPRGVALRADHHTHPYQPESPEHMAVGRGVTRGVGACGKGVPTPSCVRAGCDGVGGELRGGMVVCVGAQGIQARIESRGV